MFTSGNFPTMNFSQGKEHQIERQCCPLLGAFPISGRAPLGALTVLPGTQIEACLLNLPFYGRSHSRGTKQRALTANAICMCIKLKQNFSLQSFLRNPSTLESFCQFVSFQALGIELKTIYFTKGNFIFMQIVTLRVLGC